MIDRTARKAGLTTETLYQAVLDCLMNHGMQHTEDTGSGEKYPLVDKLCAPGDDSIKTGKEEVEILAEDIVDAIGPMVLAAHSADARNVEGVWQPIDTAPKDGTFIDLWIGGEFPRREPDCYWGLPDHCCGEMGSLCDSDWHGLDKGWVGSYNMPISDFDGGPTHWMPLPPPPTTTAKDQS